MATSAQIGETSVAVSAITVLFRTHLDDHTTRSTVTPWFKQVDAVKKGSKL